MAEKRNVWNSVQLNGHLWNGSLKTTQRGTSYFQGTLSVYDGKDGDKPKYQKVFLKAYGNNADALAREKEGAEVNIEGQLKTDVTEKDGQKRYFVYVLVQNYGEDQVKDELSSVMDDDSLPF